LEARTDPDFQDARGWTALHAACATRPHWEVLEQLLSVCDICARTHAGLLPCDIADMACHEDTSKVIKERMQQHKKAKHFPQASSALSAAAKAALGLTSVDWEAASMVGKRREDGEAVDMLRDFARVLMTKYRDSDAAFRAFDINGNGTLSGSEFVQSAKQMKWPGDVVAVFKAIDIDRQGDISKVEFRLLQHLYDETKPKKDEGQMRARVV